jgi:hypothetical protein
MLLNVVKVLGAISFALVSFGPIKKKKKAKGAEEIYQLLGVFIKKDNKIDCLCCGLI